MTKDPAITGLEFERREVERKQEMIRLYALWKAIEATEKNHTMDGSGRVGRCFVI